MKLSFLFIFFTLFQVAATGFSQTINLDVSDVEIRQVIKSIEQQTDYRFFYTDGLTDLSRKVNLNMKGQNIDKVLSELLGDTQLGYRVIDNKLVMLAPKEAMLQGITITGTVTDNGVPLPGVNVVIKGTTTGVVTDVNGKYSINVPNVNTILTYSFVGYATTEFTVGEQRTIDIALDEDTREIEEVVVVGYGTQKKVTLTGSVSSIQNDEIITTKNENVENMLSGKIPGVRIVQKTSEPGWFYNTFQIRGMGNPLIIVDGVPRENMNRLDANEIENISILKDASAAIYGVRAANGVVLVTTKRGKEGKFHLDYNGSVGWQKATGLPESCDAIEFMTLMNENAINNGRAPMYSDADFESYRNGTKQSTDWQGSILRNFAPLTQHNFSANGQTDKLSYFVNFGYLNQEGFWKSGDLNYERFNLRSNVSAQLTKHLKAEVLLGAMKDTKNAPYTDAWLVYKSLWMQVPTWPLYANDNPDYMYNAGDADHPIAVTDSDISGYKKNDTKGLQSTFNLEYDVPFISGLKAKASYSYDYTSWEAKEFEKEFTLYTYDATTQKYNSIVTQSPSSVRRSVKEYESSLLQLSLNYNRTFNEVHHIGILALYEENTQSMDNFYAKRQLSLDAVDELFAGNSLNQEGSMNSSGYAPNTALYNQNGLWKIANKGWVGRINYDYASKYIAEFSFRMDGSSKFASGHQWGFFPSGSIGWRMSEESFIKDNESLSFINNLKLRASYGKMGDDNSSTYQFLTGYDYPSGGYVFDDTYVNALGMRGMANPNIMWFTSKMFNVGIDADLWKGLIGFQVDYFVRDRSGLLATRSSSLPGTVGATLPQENLEGDMTKGFEIALTHRNKIKDFTYYFSGNFSYSRTNWTKKEISRQGNSYRNWRNNYTDRYSDIWWGYGYIDQFTSYDEVYNSAIMDSKGNSTARPGDYQYVDWNGDGVIDDWDKHPIATTGDPKIYFGFTIGAEWKGFDLTMLFQGGAMSNVRYIEQLEKPLNWDRNGLAMFMDRWHLSDMNDPDSEWIPGYYPSTNQGETRNYEDSERSVQNATYLRLKSLEFGYTFPKQWLSKAGIQRLRLYFNAYNLFTITGVKYLDPEHPSDQWGYLYPLSKTYNVGVNVSF